MTARTLDPIPDGVHVASQTDVGRVRAANEDSCDVVVRSDGARLLVVADGMGGHRGGATASQTATTRIVEAFRAAAPDGARSELLSRAIQAANAEIYEQASLDPELEGMGTTVVALLLDVDGRACVAHVGDSRAYRDRDGNLEPLTSDHSVVAEMQKRGLLTPEEAASHPRRNEILRSVGVLPDVEVETASIDIRPGDRFLLCSDGLTGLVADDEIADVLRTKTPDEAVSTLIDLANERGGLDNVTVQVLAIPAQAGGLQKDATGTAAAALAQAGADLAADAAAPATSTPTPPPTPQTTSARNAGLRRAVLSAILFALVMLLYTLLFD